ncbi:MAG: DUF447 domain-containing protein [Promethearchaeota archaeon]
MILFKYRDFGLKKNTKYEILAVTYSKSGEKENISPNTSCMGIKVIEDNIIKIGPYPNTTTYKNLKASGLITINFVDNIYLYALAALKEDNSPLGLTKFPSEYYNYYEDRTVKNYVEISKQNANKILIPYINKAWLILIGKVIEENQITKKDGLGKMDISEFKISITFFKKFRDSFNFFNRAENLALEAIILATRLKVAKVTNNRVLFNQFYEKMNYIIENIKRFSKNENALKTIDLVSRYIKTLMD